MIYYFDAIDQFTQEMCDHFIHRLPIERQQRVRRYKRHIDQKLSILSYVILLHGLRLEHGIHQQVQLGYKDHHKPYLLDYPAVHFNISHCECCVAVAISSSEVGIDVQNNMEYDHKLASYVCSELELEQLALSNNPDRLFIQYWTLKESYLKMIGTGLTEQLKRLDFSEALAPSCKLYNCRFQMMQEQQYIISTCSPDHHVPIQSLRLIDLSFVAAASST